MSVTDVYVFGRIGHPSDAGKYVATTDHPPRTAATMRATAPELHGFPWRGGEGIVMLTDRGCGPEVAAILAPREGLNPAPWWKVSLAAREHLPEIMATMRTDAQRASQ